MSLSGTVLRRVPNKPLQQAVRYYVQHGPLDFVSMALWRSIAGASGADLATYVDENSLYREELLETLPEDRVLYYDSPGTYNLAEPLSVGRLPDRFRQSVGAFTRDQPFVAELDDVTLVGPTANPKTADGRYVRDAQGVDRNQLIQSIIAEKLTAPRRLANGRARHLDTGVVLTNGWSENHFHWQLDFLPRLKGVEAYRRERGVMPRLIVGPDPPGWQLEYLDLLGYGPDDYYVYDGTRLTVDTLVVPYGVRFKRAQIRWVRERLLDRLPDDQGDDGLSSKVYISRDDALCRRVLNEDELLGALADKGFVRVRLSEMPLAEQIRLFSRADTVVGPHGAGFANVMYAEETSVVELYGAKEGPSTFHLAGILGHPYACIRCDTVGEDLVVDVADVTRMLDRL